MYILATLFSILCLAFCQNALAQQPISGNYAPGAFTGMKAAIQPPPETFIFENGTMFYNTRDFVNSSGDTLPISTVNAVANRTILGYVTDWKIFGGDYFPAVILPFANVALRPQPGSRKDFQFGDMILQPLALGWHQDQWHYQFAYNLWLPTGRYNEGASNNVGKGLYSHMFAGGATWLEDAENPWAATLMLRYEFLGKQEDTDIKPGQVMTVEGGAGKEIFDGFDLGLTGYASFQTTKERDSAVGTDTSRYRFFGLGPEVNWRPAFLPGSQVAVRSYYEFGARNSTEGVFTVLSLAYMF
jgi:hypothetical protein